MSTLSLVALDHEVESIVCPICKTRDHERSFLDESLATRFVRCGRCRTVYLNPRPGEAPRASYYERARLSLERHMRTAELRRPAFQIIAKVLHRYKKTGDYLDIGCNTGALFEHFDSPAWRRDGVESDSALP